METCHSFEVLQCILHLPLCTQLFLMLPWDLLLHWILINKLLPLRHLQLSDSFEKLARLFILHLIKVVGLSEFLFKVINLVPLDIGEALQFVVLEGIQ